MTYVRSVLFRWSRRDRLAVLLVAVTIAFLVGTTLVLVATSAETTGVAAQFDAVGEVSRYDSVKAARLATGPEAVVLPVTAMNDDRSRQVVGVPRSEERPPWLGDIRLETPPSDGVAVTDPVGDQVQFRGPASTLTVPVHERGGGGVVPPSWAVATPSLVQRLGPTSALVLTPSRDGRSAADGTPIQASLGFFQQGSEQVVGALTLIGGGSAVLVAVIVFGVVRMTARDRRRTIFVVRATGGTRRRVFALFALRGAMLAGVGVALGYAVGVITTNLAVNAAVTLGLPTSLSARVTPTVARILGGTGVGIVALAALTAPFAARPVATDLTDHESVSGRRASTGEDATKWRRSVARLRRWCRPRLVSFRAVVPITLSLWTFAVIAFLLVAGATAAAPLSGEGATVVEPGVAHPVASTVPVAYADALEESGTAASPEILAFTVLDGEPAMVRGARFDDFAAVSDATLIAGDTPSGPSKAVIGADLAETLDLERGQTVAFGGSTTPALTTVEIVGVYEAPGPYDDSFVVPLATARHLSNRNPGTVQFIRTSSYSDPSTAEDSDPVVGLSVPSTVSRGEQARVVATLVNPRSTTQTQNVSLLVDGTSVTRRQVTVQPLATTKVTFTHTMADVGSHTIRVRSIERRIRVVSPDTPHISELPVPVPAGSQPLVRIRTANGTPVANATVSVGNRTYRTDADGSVRVSFPTAGETRLAVSADGHEINRTVSVADNQSRTVIGSLAVQPRDPNLLTRPTARVTLSNSWNTTLSSRVILRTNRVQINRTVSLGPGERRTIAVRLDRQGQGTYPVELAVDDRVADRTNVTVEGGERLASALATTDATVPASGLGTGVATVLGNLSILAATLAGLAGALAIGSIAAGLAGAVHRRRRTVGVYRATGAGPARIARLILGDALTLGVVATPVAIALGLGTLRLMAAFDRLVFFGVRVHPRPSLATLAVVAGGALLVVIVSGLAVTAGLLVTDPARLLGGETPTSALERQTGLDGETDD